MATRTVQGKIIKNLAGVLALPFSALPFQALSELLLSIVKAKAKALPADNSLRFLLQLENGLYELQGSQSVRYGDGVHTKHKHTSYHQFFLDNVRHGERVIDLGCGYGALAYDIASAYPTTTILAIDLNTKNIDKAKERFSRNNLTYVCGDILDNSVLPSSTFDTIILSNVLEHLPGRPEFLKAIQTKFSPKQILIRVPLFERDWRVPLKKELGIEWRLDSTHEIEYTLETWNEELEKAGLTVIHQEIRWGEIWAKVMGRQALPASLDAEVRE